MKEMKDLIRTIPDFPKEGILFRDITTLLKDPKGLQEALNLFKAEIPSNISKIVAIEARGFIFGGALAYMLGVGFVPVRKSGKLPAEKIRMEYALEYGTDVIEMHKDALSVGEKVVIVDDLLATGGTAKATCALIEKAGAIVEKFLFLIELKDLKGIDKLKGYDIFSLIKY
ncbi:adenine phosphoribosyltransferase [bacterium]|nr:adenine phosphoribosyltransferase [bacterium]